MQHPIPYLMNVSKSIKGKEIVENLNLSLAPREIFGFLGPNSAGKTSV